MAQIVRGNIDPEQIKSVGRQGDSSVIQMAGGGTKTSGHVLIYDANGNAVDGGAPSGGGTVTNSGTLTADQPVFGAGTTVVKVGTKSGNTDEVVSASGAATNGYPLLYDANGNAIARQPRGNTTVVQLADSTTSPTSGDLATFDANGNIKDGGAGLTTKGDLLTYASALARLPVGTNGQVLTSNSSATNGIDWETSPSGGYTGFGSLYPLTDPTSVSFSWRNQGGATVTTESRSLYLTAPTSATTSVRGREIAAPGSTPWSITIAFVPFWVLAAVGMGLYVTDGTKLVMMQWGSAGWNYQHYTNVTTSAGAVVTFSTPQVLPLCYVKIQNDGTNLNMYISGNGTDFFLVGSEAKTSFLSAVSFVGFFVNLNTSTVTASMWLLSWLQGT